MLKRLPLCWRSTRRCDHRKLFNWLNLKKKASLLVGFRLEWKRHLRCTRKTFMPKWWKRLRLWTICLLPSSPSSSTEFTRGKVEDRWKYLSKGKGWKVETVWNTFWSDWSLENTCSTAGLELGLVLNITRQCGRGLALIKRSISSLKSVRIIIVESLLLRLLIRWWMYLRLWHASDSMQSKQWRQNIFCKQDSGPQLIHSEEKQIIQICARSCIICSVKIVVNHATPLS